MKADNVSCSIVYKHMPQANGLSDPRKEVKMKYYTTRLADTVPCWLSYIFKSFCTYLTSYTWVFQQLLRIGLCTRTSQAVCLI